MNIDALASPPTEVIDSPRVFLAEGDDRRILDFENRSLRLNGYGCLVFRGSEDDYSFAGKLQKLTIKNLHIRAANTSADVALPLINTEGIRLENVFIHGAPKLGLHLRDVWNATLRDVVIMRCGRGVWVDSLNGQITNDVVFDRLTVERCTGLPLEIVDSGLVKVVGGSKLHGRPNNAYVGPMAVVENAPMTEISATTIARATATEGGAFIELYGRKESSTKIEVGVQRNCEGRVFSNFNTSERTSVSLNFVRAMDG